MTVITDLPVGADRGVRSFAELPEILRWPSTEVGATRIHQEYLLALSDRLGMLLATGHNHPSVVELEAELASLPDAAWLRLLTAPQCTYRLFWPSRHHPASVIDFLMTAIQVEKARLERGPVAGLTAPPAYPGPETPWSALGDGWLGPDRRYVPGLSINGFVPIDVASPHARAIDLEGSKDEIPTLRQPLRTSELQAVLDRLQGVRDTLAASMPDVFRFVVTFTKVLVLQPDHEEPELFSTGSSAQYIGRSVFGNPHLAKVDDVLLAEGLVHEAIHSVMYMAERVEPWVTDPGLYGPEQRTRSPWTGNLLPLRSYLQACFVWFGLAHFWGRSMATHAFDDERARSRLTQAVAGFLTGEVLEQLEPYRPGIVPELLNAIELVQREILEAADGVG